MATRRHLHAPHLTPAIVRAPARSLTHLERRTLVPTAIAAALLLTLVLATLLRPLSVTVGNSRAVVSRGSTIGEAAERLGLPTRPGDLVSLTGAVLRPGGGRPAILLRNGIAVPADTRLRRGDVIGWRPAGDLTEPVRERARLLPAPVVAGRAEAAVPGLRRTCVGLVSGAALVETSYAVATVPAPRTVSKPRLIALTFDDGPWPAQTSQLLAILRKNNAHATFFVLGNLARAHPALLKAAVADGNEIGLHSWNHENLARLSAGAVSANMARTQAQVQAVIGKPIRLMRPPYGALNARASQAIKAAGYRIVLWSLDTSDWRRPGASTIYSRLLRAGSKSIILCHDGGGSRSGTIQAVARAIPALQQRGYQFATVSQVLGLEALPQGGALVAGGSRQEVKPVEPGLGASLDGQPLALAEAPVEVAGQLEVPIRPLLDQLGVKWTWDREAQKLTLQGAMEKLVLRVNSTRLEHEYGPAEQLPSPPVLYRGNLMVPLWVVLQSSGATAVYDSKQNLLQLTSLDKGLETGKLGQGVPPAWGRDTRWRDWLR